MVFGLGFLFFLLNSALHRTAHFYRFILCYWHRKANKTLNTKIHFDHFAAGQHWKPFTTNFIINHSLLLLFFFNSFVLNEFYSFSWNFLNNFVVRWLYFRCFVARLIFVLFLFIGGFFHFLILLRLACFRFVSFHNFGNDAAQIIHQRRYRAIKNSQNTRI